MKIIEVFADVSCPYTHMELRRLVEVRCRLGRFNRAGPASE